MLKFVLGLFYVLVFQSYVHNIGSELKPENENISLKNKRSTQILVTERKKQSQGMCFIIFSDSGGLHVLQFLALGSCIMEQIHKMTTIITLNGPIECRLE